MEFMVFKFVLMDFYKKWYRPDLMSIVVVGDAEVSDIESALKKTMCTIPAAKDKLKRPEFTVPAQKEKSVLIMGSEGTGIASLLEKQCDTIVSIPTCGKIDSLNVSVAAGVLLYELSK